MLIASAKTIGETSKTPAFAPHQELVFMQSKIIIYDQQKGLKSIRENNEKSKSIMLNNLGKASLEQFKNRYRKLQAKSAQEKMRAIKIKNFEHPKYNKENKGLIQINLVPSASIKKIEKKSSFSRIEECGKNKQRISGNSKTSCRNSKMRREDGHKLIFPKSTTSQNISEKPEMERAQTIPVAEEDKLSSLQCQNRKSNLTEDNEKLLYPKDGADGFLEKEKKLEETPVYSHQEIKSLFGGCHQFMKHNCDYLTDQNWIKGNIETGNHLMKKFVNLRSKDKRSTEKRLEEELEILNHINPSSVSAHRQFSKMKVGPLVESNIFPLLERAPILQYLKTAETKKLLNHMIQPQEGAYLDAEFPHKKMDKIGEQQVRWVYIEPNQNSDIFGQELYRDNIRNSSLETKKELGFVGFLRCAYALQPDLIRRLFEPVFRNVYSVWLFVNDGFQPVFVDGYFPLDEQLEHFFGGSTDELWLPILIKCICKVKNTFEPKQLQTISAGEVYRMLAGFEIKKLQMEKFQNSSISEVSSAILGELEQNNQCILVTNQVFYYASQESQSGLLLFSPQTNQYRGIIDMKKSQPTIYILPSFCNFFVYGFQVREESLSKFELNSVNHIQLVFSVSSTPGQSGEKCSRRVYIYESTGTKSSREKLVLRVESEMGHSLRCKLRRGHYKIFVEDGEKKIHTLFSDRAVNWRERTHSTHCFRLSVMSSHEVQLSEIQALSRKGSNVEDSCNIYKNPKSIAQ